MPQWSWQHTIKVFARASMPKFLNEELDMIFVIFSVTGKIPDESIPLFCHHCWKTASEQLLESGQWPTDRSGPFVSDKFDIPNLCTFTRNTLSPFQTLCVSDSVMVRSRNERSSKSAWMLELSISSRNYSALRLLVHWKGRVVVSFAPDTDLKMTNCWPITRRWVSRFAVKKSRESPLIDLQKLGSRE